jgi:hypothetical protein
MTDEVHYPTGLRVDALYAWVSLDDGDGNEGIIGYPGPLGLAPAIGADRERVEQLRPIMEAAAAMHSHPIELRRFSVMTVIDTLPPGRTEGDGLTGAPVTSRDTPKEGSRA